MRQSWKRSRGAEGVECCVVCGLNILKRGIRFFTWIFHAWGPNGLMQSRLSLLLQQSKEKGELIERAEPSQALLVSIRERQHVGDPWMHKRAHAYTCSWCTVSTSPGLLSHFFVSRFSVFVGFWISRPNPNFFSCLAPGKITCNSWLNAFPIMYTAHHEYHP